PGRATARAPKRRRNTTGLRSGMTSVLHSGSGPIPAARYLPASPATVLWGRLPCEADVPVLTVDDGAVVTIDTVSHEGLLEDQGSDPVAFFAGHGVAARDVL